MLRCSGLFRSHIECCCVNHIKIKSHIGNPVTSTDINRIFFLYKYKHLNKIHFNAQDKDFKTYSDCYKQN